MSDVQYPDGSWGPWLPSEGERSKSRHESLDLKATLVDVVEIVCHVEAIQHELPHP